jgi:hypothetical protein
MTGTWLNYVDAAAALAMSVEGVRQRARREGWRKQLGNDGKALIFMPDDAARLPAEHRDGEDGEAPPPKPATPRQPPGDDAAELLALRARIGELEARSNELRADLQRERERAERERTDRLQERERAERLTGEVANMARQLARIAEEAATRERGLQDQVRAAETTIAAMRAASWWKRLRGVA